MIRALNPEEVDGRALVRQVEQGRVADRLGCKGLKEDRLEERGSVRRNGGW